MLQSPQRSKGIDGQRFFTYGTFGFLRRMLQVPCRAFRNPTLAEKCVSKAQ